MEELPFLGMALPPGEDGAATVLSLPYERSTSYIQGTVKGPRAILKASQQVELYDEELDCEPFRRGIATDRSLEDFLQSRISEDAVVDKVREKALHLIERKQLIAGLGGEHAVSLGLAQACHRRYPDLSVLQIDAHADLRDSYQGNRYSHACIMRRIAEFAPAVQVGIRSMSSEERDFLKQRKNFLTLYDRELHKGSQWMQRAVDALSEHVFITIDLDGFDPSLIPAVGTPEPGGLSWHQGLALLRRIASQRKVVGFDVVELCPRQDDINSDFIAARLTYKLLGYCLEESADG